METHTYTTQSEEETERLAATVAGTLRGGDVLLLEGELGAGKSVFVRGLGRALGIVGRMTSPTFVLMRVYAVSEHLTIRHFVHVDAYRVRDPRELIAAGLGEWLGRDDVIVAIEWGERLAGVAGITVAVRVQVVAGPSETSRTISIQENPRSG
ncbi:MAG: tRNA (adenosine(37)-N6)-threonylcarbamoyltransferase complex ATPase subunit type 1 TsaE [bacterium]|nr:tRNA (adenosine(37)-N6)-threonylcarbamoyltransferase complex ATPase subunit type 1 TsaE [bacterium]